MMMDRYQNSLLQEQTVKTFSAMTPERITPQTLKRVRLEEEEVSD